MVPANEGVRLLCAPGKAGTVRANSFPDYFNFRFQFDSALSFRAIFDHLNQFEHLAGGCCAVIDDKIAVLFRNTSATHARAFKAELFDKFPSRNGERVFKHAACAWSGWLAAPSFLAKFIHSALDGFA